MEVSNYGARLLELHVPDRHGGSGDIVLGHAAMSGYLGADPYFGATCGRFANRIADGRVSVDGVAHQLALNEGPTHLHGGPVGFDKRLWSLEEAADTHAVFTLRSDDGDMGYPGACMATTEYHLAADDRLLITMTATCDAPTPVNLVHHSYFNLAAKGAGTIHDHLLTIPASTYLPVDDRLIPTGKAEPVDGTPFDFREPTRIGGRLDEAPGGRGFDHNWCLDGEAAPLRLAAEVVDPGSGRGLTLKTNQPGLQFYTGGYLPNTLTGKSGRPLAPFAGFTLETQGFPNAPNVPAFPESILRPGETYSHVMDLTFFVH